MGIFDSIKGALGFGDEEEQTSTNDTATTFNATSTIEEASDSVSATDAPTANTVDIVSVLESKASNSSEDLDWRRSIVDLMKLVGMDASYANRKELATEMGIEDYKGTEEQNIQLHKTVLTKLAANGGNIPTEFLA